MAHIDDLYEAQAKQLLHKLCDALGIEQQDRTKSGVEKAIAGLKAQRPTCKSCVYFDVNLCQLDYEATSENCSCDLWDRRDEEAEIERH